MRDGRARSRKPQIGSSGWTRLREGLPIARAIRFAAHLLGGVGEAVEEERADEEEIIQHGVGREREVAGARALR
jgi:hypothetical protein